VETFKNSCIQTNAGGGRVNKVRRLLMGTALLTLVALFCFPVSAGTAWMNVNLHRIYTYGSYYTGVASDNSQVDAKCSVWLGSYLGGGANYWRCSVEDRTAKDGAQYTYTKFRIYYCFAARDYLWPSGSWQSIQYFAISVYNYSTGGYQQATTGSGSGVISGYVEIIESVPNTCINGNEAWLTIYMRSTYGAWFVIDQLNIYLYW
jgi:hypothetical protein